MVFLALLIISSMGFGDWGGSVISSVGSLVGSLIERQGVKDANASSARSLQDQMNYQTQMSGTSYQRGVADLRAAGLNPMLAYSQGGASSPSGSSMAFQSPGVGTGAAVRDMARMRQDFRESDSRIATNVATAAKIEEETKALRSGSFWSKFTGTDFSAKDMLNSLFEGARRHGNRLRLHDDRQKWQKGSDPVNFRTISRDEDWKH